MAKKGKLKTGNVVWFADHENKIVSAQILGVSHGKNWYMILNLTDEKTSYKIDRAPYVYEIDCEYVDQRILDCVSQMDVKAIWKDIYNAPNKGVYEKQDHEREWQKPIV